MSLIADRQDEASPPIDQFLTVPSPAKLNLFLHITGQRPDGYHELQTLFQFIDFADQMTFRLTNSGAVDLLNPIEGVPNEHNLIYRAAILLLKKINSDVGVEIGIEKRLPMGGGLGGGSSNAATTLLAINNLLGSPLTLDELADIGLTLGADVPVFVRGEACFAEGVGEIITPTPSIPEPWYIVVVPDVHISTQEIFSQKDLTRDTEIMKIRTALEQGGRNDCEAVAVRMYPEIGNILNLLKKFGSARMTGTGACIFVEFEDKEQCQLVLSKLPAEITAYMARGYNTSPAHSVLFS